MKPIKKILVPTDFSDCARTSVNDATDLALQFGANLTLLHVYQLPAYAMTEGSLLYGDEILKAVETAAQVELDKVKTEAEARLKKPVETKLALSMPVETKLLMGSPYAEIVKEARDGAYDLIVIGTHGRTGLKHVFLGSVAERVVQLAPCPVLTIHKQGSRP